MEETFASPFAMTARRSAVSESDGSSGIRRTMMFGAKPDRRVTARPAVVRSKAISTPGCRAIWANSGNARAMSGFAAWNRRTAPERARLAASMVAHSAGISTRYPPRFGAYTFQPDVVVETGAGPDSRLEAEPPQPAAASATAITAARRDERRRDRFTRPGIGGTAAEHEIQPPGGRSARRKQATGIRRTARAS